MTGAVSGGVTGTVTLPSGWFLYNGYLIGAGAVLTNANLANGDFTNANFQNTNLSGADLTGSTLNGVISGGIVGTPLALPDGWQIISGYLVGLGG